MFLSSICIGCFLWNIFHVNVVAADDDNTYKFTNLKCTSIDPSHLQFTKCQLKAINRSLTHLTVHTDVKKSPFTHASLRMKFWKKANGYMPFLIDITLDLCTFLNGRNIPMFTPFYDMSKPYTNVNTSCPLPDKLIIEKLPIHADKIPSTWPSGDYRIDVTISTFDKPRSLVNVYVVVGEKMRKTKPKPKTKPTKKYAIR